MDWTYLLTNFTGRIGRQKWWIGSIVMFVIAIVLYFAVMPLLGLSMMAGFDPEGGAEMMMGMMRKAAIAQIVLTAILAYPATALMKKRLNDRDRPDWYLYLFWAPTVVGLLLGITGTAFKIVEVDGQMMPLPTTLSTVVTIVSVIIGLWTLVELGFLKGTAGPNRHGPDPGAG